MTEVIVQLVAGILFLALTLIIIGVGIFTSIRDGAFDGVCFYSLIPLIGGLLLTILAGFNLKQINREYIVETSIVEVFDKYYVAQTNDDEKTYYEYRAEGSNSQSKVEVKGNCYFVFVENDFKIKEVKEKGKDYSYFYFLIPEGSIKY